MKITEMRMLKKTCGVTRSDRIENKHIGGSFRVTDISIKMKENRLKRTCRDKT